MSIDRRVDPEGTRLPIKLDSTSNGEFAPVPLSAANRLSNRLACQFAAESSKQLGLGRREFLVSSCGAASTLLAFNAANAAAGKTGGFFDVPREAAHALGKLIKHCRGDNVLWGTDSIWYGSPQDQIQAFRAFQIAPALREQHGYAEITPALRAKIFGLSAATVYGISAAEVKRVAQRDELSGQKLAYAAHPEPHFLTYGPKSRREFLRMRHF